MAAVASVFRQNLKTEERYSFPSLSIRPAPTRHESENSIDLGRLVSHCLLALQ